MSITVIIKEKEAINMREHGRGGKVAGRGWREKREREGDVILLQFKTFKKRKSTYKFQ